MKPSIATPRRALWLSLAIALVGVLSCWALAAEAGDITRSTGLTQPVLADFSPQHAQVRPTAGYRQDILHRLFLETLTADCGPAQGAPRSAVFVITLRRLSDPQWPSNGSRLIFWDGGRQHFGTYIWSSTDARGAVKRLSFLLNDLPPAGGPVVHNSGSNIDLLRDGRFSFSVHDDASVLQARLHWKCAAGPAMPTVDGARVAPAPAAQGRQRLHAGFTFGASGRSTVTCPPAGSVFPRSPLETDALMKQLGPRADALCRRQNFQAGYGSVRVLSCDVNEQGQGFGVRTRTEIVCVP